jgi:hypothetical protein
LDQSKRPVALTSASSLPLRRNIVAGNPPNWTRANAPVALTSASSFPLRRNIVAVNPKHWTRANEPVALTSASSPSTKHDFFPAQTKHRRGQSSTLDKTKRLSRANQRFIEAYYVYKS